MKVICHIDKPETVAYLDVYEVGDEWVKVKGCEGCPNIKICCGDCPMLTSKGCFFHIENTNSKPFRCVVQPTPETCLKWCQLEFECIRGTHKGKIRRIKDTGNVFVEKNT